MKGAEGGKDERNLRDQPLRLTSFIPRFYRSCLTLVTRLSLPSTPRYPSHRRSRALRAEVRRDPRGGGYEVRDGTLRERPTAREASRERCESGGSSLFLSLRRSHLSPRLSLVTRTRLIPLRYATLRDG